MQEDNSIGGCIDVAVLVTVVDNHTVVAGGDGNVPALVGSYRTQVQEALLAGCNSTPWDRSTMSFDWHDRRRTDGQRLDLSSFQS